MTTVTICVESRDAMKAKFVAAMKGEAQGNFITFDTAEDLLKMLTQMRWQILRTMAGAGSMSIRELARRLDRDVKRVHDDMNALLNAGVLERTEDGSIVFPYDAVHVDFTLTAVKPG